MKALAAVLLLVACGGDDDRVDADLAATLSVRSVATFSPDGIASMDLAAIDDTRIAIARVDHVDGAFCPDCVGLDPSMCPSVCESATVSVSTVSLATGEVSASLPVATVFPRSYDHAVNQVATVSLGGDKVGVAWLDCDNAVCGGFAAKLSCTAYYQTLDLTSGALGAPATLYTDWFGHLSLAFDPSSRHLVAVLGKDLVMGLGVWRAVFDDQGNPVAPWKALGSTGARSPAIVPGSTTVIADDWSPSLPPRAAPCADSCECLDGGQPDLDRGGLFAFDGTGAATQIAPGRDADNFYGLRQEITAIDAGGRTVVATTQSIDRNAELFAYDGTWHPLLTSAAPLPLWIAALGTADHAAWVGARPDRDQASVQSIEAGISTPDGSTVASLDDPLERAVLVNAAVPTSTGVTTDVLLQGIYDRSTSEARWARFELIAVEASWP